jgi:RNA polymerase sigma factor (sigma-70 family)
VSGFVNQSDQSALLATYLERRAELLRYFRIRLRSDEAARELVQEIYLKIAQRSSEMVDREALANPGAYLFRLGTNLMLDRIRRDRRAERRAAAYGEVYAAAGAETIDDAPTAEDALAARQKLGKVIEAIRDLTPNAQRAFYLHKIEGLSHAETAAAMGVSRSSVEKYLMACLKAALAKVGEA